MIGEVINLKILRTTKKIEQAVILDESKIWKLGIHTFYEFLTTIGYFKVMVYPYIKPEYLIDNINFSKFWFNNDNCLVSALIIPFDIRIKIKSPK